MTTQFRIQDFERSEDRFYSQELFDAIVSGMWPFRMKSVDVYYDYDIDFNKYRMFGEVRLLSGHTIGFCEPVDAWEMAADPDKIVFELCAKFFQAFRNRETHPVPSNIKLGEE